MGPSKLLPAALLLCLVELAHAQVVGLTAADVAVVRIEEPIVGRSARKQILDRPVYNDIGQRVGKIQDLILDPSGNASLVIIGAGGFVGLKRHQIALPVELLTERDGFFILNGATKEAIKGLPTFAYARPVVAQPLRKLRASPDDASACLQPVSDR